MVAVPEYPAEFLRGVEEFDRGDFFAAHEAWEAVWRQADPADRRFYQSLIQAAVALYHLGRGNLDSAARLARRGRAKAAGYPSCYRGIDLNGFWHDLTVTLAGGPAPTLRLVSQSQPAGGPDHV